MGGLVHVTNTLGFYDGLINATLPAHGISIYRMDVPREASRIIF